VNTETVSPPQAEQENKTLKTGSDSSNRVSKKEKKRNRNKRIKNEILVFLVDDDKFFLTGVYTYLSDALSPKIKLKTFSTAEECLDAMEEKPKIVVLDHILSSGPTKSINGLSALKQINIISPETYVIMLSAQDSVDVALDIINEGAYDYISKNATAFIRLKNMINNLAERISLTMEQERDEILTKRINIFIIVLLLLLFIVSRVIH
jgi:DNA-binding NtrC family response regulator